MCRRLMVRVPGCLNVCLAASSISDGKSEPLKADLVEDKDRRRYGYGCLLTAQALPFFHLCHCFLIHRSFLPAASCRAAVTQDGGKLSWQHFDPMF